MSAVYDDACPACRDATSDCERVGCAGCGAYAHAACWRGAKGCVACGGHQSLADRDALRRASARSGGRRILLAGAVIVLLLGAATFGLAAYETARVREPVALIGPAMEVSPEGATVGYLLAKVFLGLGASMMAVSRWLATGRAESR